jgi:Bax protein
MTNLFQRGVLVATAVLTVGTMGLAVFNPPQPVSAAPQARFDPPAPRPVSRLAQMNISIPVVKVRASTGETTSLGRAVGVRPLAASRAPVALHTADSLDQTFNRLGYDLNTVRAGSTEVPRVFLASLPRDLGKVREVQKRKALFFKTVLPLVLQVNEEILSDRKRLWDLHSRTQLGGKLGAVDRLWLVVMAERYKVKRGDLKSLLQRVDIIPPSLALAQAAEESGWGTSRFSREGNAIFGEWTFDSSQGLIPLRRESGKTHRVKAFPSLLESVRAYARNLNTHRAYRELRSLRLSMRRGGQPVDGWKLVDTLSRYSERGEAYIKGLRAMISQNKLRRLDDARLSDDRVSASPII